MALSWGYLHVVACNRVGANVFGCMPAVPSRKVFRTPSPDALQQLSVQACADSLAGSAAGIHLAQGSLDVILGKPWLHEKMLNFCFIALQLSIDIISAPHPPLVYAPDFLTQALWRVQLVFLFRATKFISS